MKLPITLLASALITAAPLAIAAPNLVANGSFEAGNTGFTSVYSYSPAGNSDEGQYTVRANPSPWNRDFISAADHTTGSGLMYVGNGSPVDGSVVWQSATFAVTANANYFFEAFVMNVCCIAGYSGANSASVLEFSINGASVGTRTTNLALAGTWEGLSTPWNSGSASTAELRLINRNTARGGNDFAVDDVSLSVESTVISSPVPEPTTTALMLLGLAGVGLAARRKTSHQRD